MINERRLLVAYEMGLGKTVIVIAAVEALIDRGDIGGGLIIVPASLKYQWARQILAFTDNHANVLVVDGDLKSRIRHYELIKANKVEYAILNYEQVVNDWRFVKCLPRDFIVLDEATAIKGLSSLRSKRVKRMKAHYHWALTGQPVENRPEEIYSIMEWVDPNVLGSHDLFEQTFIKRNSSGQVKGIRNGPLLHKVLGRSMVRATWDEPEIAAQMPIVVTEEIPIECAPSTAKLYRLIAADLLNELAAINPWSSFNIDNYYSGQQGGMEDMGQVMSRIMCLRMLCDDPALLRLSADLADGTVRGALGTGSVYAAELKAAGLLDTLRGSRKTDEAVELCREILDANPRNKIVLFSFFKEALRILGERISTFTGTALLTGDVSTKDRDAAQQKFATDPNCRVFLSSDAGGYGVDLPHANYLISFDLPWSAGAWKQRNARIIRLSSDFRKVTLISLIMVGSIEERQYETLQIKQSLAGGIVDGKGFDARGSMTLSMDSLTEFLLNSTV